jgi:hypothetical protein
LLCVIEHNSAPKINVGGINHIDFYVHTNTSAEQREAILDACTVNSYEKSSRPSLTNGKQNLVLNSANSASKK